MNPECDEFLRGLGEDDSSAEHLQHCHSCREYRAMLNELAVWRDSISGAAAASAAGGRGARRSTWRRFAVAAIFAFQAFGLLVAGYVLGKRARPETQPVSMAATVANDATSRFILSDVRLLGVEGDVVDISAVAGEEVRLRLRRDHPLVVREVVQAWLHGGSTNQRLEAARLADPSRAGARDALLSAIRSDPNDAVQLAAFSRVASLPPDEALVETLLAVLSSSEDTALKLRAVDYLVLHRVPPERLRGAVAEGDGPVLVRAAAYLTREN